MNTKITVRKSDDSNYIKVKYAIIEMAVGADAANTNCVIQCIGVGWDTEEHYNGWKSTWDGANSVLSGRDPTGIQGTLGALEVVALSALTNYTDLTPSRDI